MKPILLDHQPQVCEAWRIAFAEVPTVQVYNGSFASLVGAFDCLVSPANSFGLMDGGMDAAIIRFFGSELEQRVQAEIWRLYRGEQPVGTCLMVPTEDPRCPWLAHCPTMRVPMDISWTNHAYAAFLAALTTAEAHGVQTLACPASAPAPATCLPKSLPARCASPMTSDRPRHPPQLATPTRSRVALPRPHKSRVPPAPLRPNLTRTQANKIEAALSTRVS